MSLRFLNRNLSRVLELDTNLQSESPYPIAASLGAAVTFGNGVQCQFPHTVQLDDAVIDVDFPIELDSRRHGNRVLPGRRWLRTTGVLSTGELEGCINSANFNTDRVRLLVDDLPLVSDQAPNVILGANETISVDLLWDIPADAQSVMVVFTGVGGDTAAIEVTVPDLPTLFGE